MSGFESKRQASKDLLEPQAQTAVAEPLSEIKRLRDTLSSLLAVIHGDGGHYESEHGTTQAAEDAIAKFHEWIIQADLKQFTLTTRVLTLETAIVESLRMFDNWPEGAQAVLKDAK